VCATNPRTGDRPLIRALRLISARDDEEFQSVLAVKENHKQVPWVESRFVDGDAGVLQADQPGSRRIFKTHMTHQGLKVGQKNSPKYVATLRHPIDVRLSFVAWLAECYASSVRASASPFASHFTPDDFNEVSMTTGQIMPNAKILTYEHACLRWFRDAREHPETVCAVLYEQLVTQPARVVVRLAKFLEVELSDARRDAIVNVLKEEGLLEDRDYDALSFSFDSCERFRKKWKRALESAQIDEPFDDYEALYLRASGGDPYPFPVKVYPPPPLKNGPLDKLGRKAQEKANAAKSKCVVS